MSTEVVYHGANGDNILSIIHSGEMRPADDGRIFFARFEWANALMHGADSLRRETFVIKVRVHVPPEAGRRYESTDGVRDTLILETRVPVRTEVLELHVRSGTRPDFAFKHVVGVELIKAYLTT